MEKFIQLPGGANAFITGCPDDSGCDHSWDGDELITFLTSGVRIFRADFDKLTEGEQKKMQEGNAVMGECTCSKCKMPYTVFDNPYYH